MLYWQAAQTLQRRLHRHIQRGMRFAPQHRYQLGVVQAHRLLPQVTHLLQLAQYPGLKIELLHPEPDVAERLLRPQQALLVARRMGAVGLGLHAHQSYMQQHGTPHSLADLAQHALIGFDTETPFIRRIGKS
jgi:hypothetical protein